MTDGKGRLYGYARVSSREQNLARQMNALREFGVESELIYADKASGKDFERKEYRRSLRRLHEGDVLVVKSIDRLGRNYDEILEQWRMITKERKVQVVVLDMPLLDTRSRADGLTNALISDIVLQLLSYVAQMERDNIRSRQAEGIAAAKARGVKFGRPRKQRPNGYEMVKGAYLAREITRHDAAEELGVCESTFGRWLNADRENES